MTDFIERHYSIDPGKGKKMDGCPYSIYEDGQDVKDYIIPPKGYIFVGFRFDPEASNQIYDGKLTAEYAKEPFNQRIMANLWKFILAFVIIAVIALIVILVAGVFKNPKPNRPVKEPTTVIKTEDSEKNDKKNVIQEKTPTVNTDSIVQIQSTETVLETTETPIEAQEEKTSQSVTTDDPNVQFKQDFWMLIHQRTIMMDPYDNLYKENKNKVEGEEYDYLRFTILKDYSTFKVWYGKLHKIPVSELETINTITDLKKKLNTIE